MTGTDQQSTAPVESDYRLTRRALFPLVGAAALAAALAPAAQADAQEVPSPGNTGPGDEPEDPGSDAQPRFVYVGTYTRPNTAPGGVKPSTALGIYVFKMNGRTGGLELVQIVEDTPSQPLPNPSWLTFDSRQHNLYATSEVSMWRGAANNGGVTAFSVAPASGKLTRLNDQPSGGAIPAVVTPDPTGRYVLRRAFATDATSVLPRHTVAQAGGWHGLERLDDHYVQPRGTTIREKLAGARLNFSQVEKTEDAVGEPTLVPQRS